MFINRELEAKLTKVVDHLATSIGDEEVKEKSLQEKIEALQTVIDGLKVEKRDLEIAIKTVKSDNELEKKKMDAGFNREKIDINHLIKLDKENADQTLAHEKKMLDLQIKEKEVELGAKYNEKLRVIIEARDAENQRLLAAHMKDLKDTMAGILERLPTVTVGNIKTK